MDLIKLINVKKTYKTGVTAIQDLNLKIEKGDFVFNPLDITVSVSFDGEKFTEAAHVEYPAEDRSSPNGVKDFTVSFPETSAKYLKVTAKTIDSLPEWHGAHGSKGFLFVDEVVVR